jgi:phosphatidylglycerophosphatase A
MSTFATDSSHSPGSGSPVPEHDAGQKSEPATDVSPLPAHSPGDAAPRRVDQSFVRSHPAHFIAFGGGIGLSPAAPGTAGTLATLPLFWVLNYFLAPQTLLMLIGAMFIVGVWACARTGRALGEHDHGGMVWDEMTAFCLVLLFTPDNVVWQSFAFLLFRLFDIIKPPPIGYYDSRLRGGFGVMFDDILAAFYALLCLAAWKAFAA